MSDRGGLLESLDERGRVTVKPRFRRALVEGFVQVLTPEGVLLVPAPKRIRTDAPSLADVDDEAMKDL